MRRTMMGKPPTSWKAFERRVCRMFGGDRRGAYTSDGVKGKSDCKDTPGFSIECKLLKRPTFGQMESACRQAETNADNATDIPVAIVKKNGRGIPDNNALVIMRLETFKEFFL